MKITANQLAQLIANRAPQSLRDSWSNASSSSNTKQTQAWYDFGWPAELCFDDLYKMYRRSSMGKCVVNAKPDICWMKKPTVFEGLEADTAADSGSRTAFERTFDMLADNLSLFKQLRHADAKARVGYYSALIIQVSGSPEQVSWDKKLDRVRPEQIIKLIPVYSEQLKPSTWEESQTSPRYGYPITYDYQESAVGDSRSGVTRAVTIHHSRVIVFTECPESDSIYGIPELEACFNDLLMLELICGAGGQGFWKNAAGKMVFNIADPSSAPSQTELEEMDESIAEFVSQLDKHQLTSGMDVTQLQAMLDNPEPFKSMYQENISASTGIPKNRLIGSQTGVLAGDKDDASFLSSMNSRNANWCASMVNQFIDWCIEHGALPRVKYTVEFDDLLSASDEQRFTLVDKMTSANDKHITSQVKLGASEISPLFTDEEMRLVAGYKQPVKIIVEQEEDVIDEPVDEQIADA